MKVRDDPELYLYGWLTGFALVLLLLGMPIGYFCLKFIKSRGKGKPSVTRIGADIQNTNEPEPSPANYINMYGDQTDKGDKPLTHNGKEMELESIDSER